MSASAWFALSLLVQQEHYDAVARWADEVQSVDSDRLAVALDKAVRIAKDAGDRTTSLDVLIQVSIDGDPARGGAPLDTLAQLADLVVRSGELRLRGLMAVAPLGEHPATAFARLADVRAGFLASYPSATWLSAGMSGDLEDAIGAGATHVRVGSAVLGSRPRVE